MSSTRTVDNRGLACPQPVLNTKRALEETGGPVLSIVDNEAARENVTRFAQSQGYRVELKKEEGVAAGAYHLYIYRAGEGGASLSQGVSTSEPTTPSRVVSGSRALAAETARSVSVEREREARVVLLGGDRLGRGSEELGAMLMHGLVYTLSQADDPPEFLVCVNAGVNLTAEGSPVLSELKALEAKGTQVLSCGTCLDYFQLKDKLAVGRVSNMYEIVGLLDGAQRVISL